MAVVFTWKSGVYHLLAMCHVHMEATFKFSASEYILPCVIMKHLCKMKTVSMYIRKVDGSVEV